MSGCSCSESRELRVTGEVWDHCRPEAVGTGNKSVRVRCAECGGKVGKVGSDVLTGLFGIDDDDIVAGRCLEVDDRPTLTVDLV